MGLEHFVAYYRVSTARQGQSGLVLEAQQHVVREHLRGIPHKMAGSFTEIESGKRSDRPALQQALAECRLRKAVLIVPKLDRLSCNVQFLLTVFNRAAAAEWCSVIFLPFPMDPLVNSF
jgi:DNA invertase Pin-like site-specific DNA recombinase